MCRTGIFYEYTTDLCLYIPFCVVYICLGVIQIISGIFYFITIPVIKLIINIGVGCWIILTGISGGMVACVSSSSARKHEYLLYCSFSVLLLNTINLILLEFGQFKELFHENLQKQMSREYNVLESQYGFPKKTDLLYHTGHLLNEPWKNVPGRIITTTTAIASVVIAFIQSQITFCLLNKSQIAHRKTIRQNRSLYVDNDQYVDLEYVIPKKNVSKVVKSTTVQPSNAKSWVFDETEDHQRQSISSTPSTSTVSPTRSIGVDPSPYNGPKNSNQKNRRTSRISDANSERFMYQMTSFSRCATPSPVPRSGQVTPTPFNSGDYHDTTGQVANRLTVDFLSSVAKVKVPNNNSQGGPSSLSSMSMQDDSQYASMLAELEKSIIEKKIQAGFSPDDVSQSTDKYCSSKSSSKDLEFSKELEAALQLIQELETPSEGPLEHLTLSPREIIRSESEKTLSAAVSLPSPDAGPTSAERSLTSPPLNENCTKSQTERQQ